MQTVTYDELEAALAAAAAPQAAAEAHGALCGALAARDALDAADWLQELLPEGGAGGDEDHARHVLTALFEETAAALAAGEMDFAPLLPDDEAPLERRAAALAEWCAGFLYGIGTGRLAGADLPEAVQEVLRDLAEVSRACVDPEDSEESNESSYVELVEYLRACVQLSYEELALRRSAGAAG